MEIFPFEPEMTAKILYTHVTLGSHCWVSKCWHSISYLLATPISPLPAEHLYLNCYSEKKGVNFACCVVNATFKDCLVTLRNEIHLRSDGSEVAAQLALIKRGCLVTSLWGCLPPSQLWSHHFKVMKLLWWSVAYHRRKTATLFRCKQGGLESCLLSEG